MLHLDCSMLLQCLCPTGGSVGSKGSVGWKLKGDDACLLKGWW
jgi:hypothetical protein